MSIKTENHSKNQFISGKRVGIKETGMDDEREEKQKKEICQLERLENNTLRKKKSMNPLFNPPNIIYKGKEGGLIRYDNIKL